MRVPAPGETGETWTLGLPCLGTRSGARQQVVSEVPCDLSPTWDRPSRGVSPGAQLVVRVTGTGRTARTAQPPLRAPANLQRAGPGAACRQLSWALARPLLSVWWGLLSPNLHVRRLAGHGASPRIPSQHDTGPRPALSYIIVPAPRSGEVRRGCAPRTQTNMLRDRRWTFVGAKPCPCTSLTKRAL